ncbi:hypothetical protein [Streptosporangium canum]|uniref:hypothetical protein n=1 Tax=Streptosporangium canum TaxID=324952 RepID=UPI00378EA6ED
MAKTAPQTRPSARATALAAASGHEVDVRALPFAAIELTGGAVEFDAFDTHWRCPLDTYVCEEAAGSPPGDFLAPPRRTRSTRCSCAGTTCGRVRRGTAGSGR